MLASKSDLNPGSGADPHTDLQLETDLREGEGKRALVTGLRGFTGYYVARELAAAGYRVFGTVRPGNDLGTDVLAVDLCDRAAVGAMVEQVQPDVVVHLAGIAFVAHTDAEQIYRVNVVGTRNLLEALAGARHKASSVQLASSANIYGNADVAVIDENVAPAPANDYAVSKLAMEYMARLWMDKLPIVIVRPFNYTGQGQSDNFLLAKIVAHFRRRERSIELGNLAISRDFSDVRMVARSYRRLLAAAPRGEAFNICSGRSNSLAEVIDLASGIAGYRIEVQVNPAFVRANDVLTLSGSNAKLAGVIGPLDPPPLAETLRWMLQG
ncbi:MULTISPECIES: NAD-dependent epimerase/dehydratase family protein [unclassified Massilia]|uniref:NAD-dependent epimerase/dehydratase family protein n=1 Tax=unclassified Massilia TaxID=2609279 RepID=UPI0017839DA2|nr:MULTISPECIES: GDP-mannose 4,6-dehydratase [unclassified Massilia]MBD8532867.1 GDP-mannose 4,6-dehydratase [Massilia sp. CFBP 13647]MBD8676228.1 GDP-mannose 4,6-dehydratase [Massilia sp. CFBP 13721]